jgi:hypothetical protein
MNNFQRIERLAVENQEIALSSEDLAQYSKMILEAQSKLRQALFTEQEHRLALFASQINKASIAHLFCAPEGDNIGRFKRFLKRLVSNLSYRAKTWSDRELSQYDRLNEWELREQCFQKDELIWHLRSMLEKQQAVNQNLENFVFRG